jgi:cyanate permease
MLVCMAIPAMLNTGFIFQIFSILGEHGVDRTTTAFVLSLIPIVSFACSLASGFIVEKVRVHIMLGVAFSLSIIPPFIWLVTSESYMVFPFAIAWGIAQGLLNISFAVVLPNYFGRQYLGSIQSITAASGVVGSALGPVAFGLAFDQLGSYSLIMIISIIIWFTGAVLAFLSPPPLKK